jgi:rSAM/selenodomain-associated transferase 2
MEKRSKIVKIEKLSVIIPVLNEEKQINITLKSLFTSLDFANIKYEIIVVDGNKNTLNAISPEFSVLKLSSKKGRGVQMNYGAKNSSGSHLLFLHADSILPVEGISCMIAAFQNGYHAGSFDLKIDSSSKTLKVFTMLAALRSRVTRVPFGDQGHFIEKKLFENMLGYAEIPLMEDIELMVSIRKRGIPITILFVPVLTSGRRWEKEGVWFGSIRNHIIRTAHRWGISSEILAKFYSQGENQ